MRWRDLWPRASCLGGAAARCGRGTRGGRRRGGAGSAGVWVRALASSPVSRSRWVQAMRSCASRTISSQTWLWSKSRNGRLRSPVSLSLRMWSSTRARPRWWRSSVGDVGLGLVGQDRLEAVPVVVGERELRAGVRALAADDHARPGRPGGQVEVFGDLCDLPVGALDCRPDRPRRPSMSSGVSRIAVRTVSVRS